MQSNERLVYINGKLVPEKDATISIFDIGRLYGVTMYESIRTFGHKFFKLDEHLDRLEASLNYVGLGEIVSRKEVETAVCRCLEANIHLTDAEDDMWVCVEVTAGNAFPMPLMGKRSGKPTLFAYSSNLPHDTYVKNYTEGKRVVTSHFRNIPPQSYEQRCKNRSRMPHFMSKLHAARIDPDAFAMLLDIDGFITEGTGANIFFAIGGELYTPTTRNILNGISRQTAIELATELNIKVHEKDITLYEAYNADEAFWTTTSYCVLPISAVDGKNVGIETYPGPITQKLLDKWSQKVGVDIVGQARQFAGKNL